MDTHSLFIKIHTIIQLPLLHLGSAVWQLKSQAKNLKIWTKVDIHQVQSYTKKGDNRIHSQICCPNWR